MHSFLVLDSVLYGIITNFHWFNRAILSAGPYHDTSEEGKFYAVVLEQTQVHVQVQGSEGGPGSPMGGT